LQELEGGYHDLIGNSPQMRRVYETVQQVADTDLTVLVRGASGTGKELVARALHNSSMRCNKPFVAVNCAAFSESLLETELFGHEKGAFTGADQTKPGRFERANGGTLFLDEAGDIPLTTQIKLLRVLESREYERVGGTQILQTDMRIIAATNRDLESLIVEGTFREDFYYRLNVLPVYLPPLRERLEDIPLLANHFLHTIAARTQAIPAKVSRGALDRLLAHTWPGNVRELQHVIERAVAIYAHGRALTANHIEQALGIQTPRATSSALSVRQQELITLVHQSASTCTVDDLFAQSSTLSEGMGKSKRTLQNDLRKLADMGYLTWQKRGSARTYDITPRGAEVAHK
jgi:two-component system, NtrC family, response regulator HydG